MIPRRWLTAALALIGLASGCSQFNTNLSTQTSSSVLEFLSPASVPVDKVSSTGLQITATGVGFVNGAMIVWNVGPKQVVLTNTQFVSSTQLTAIVPASNFPTTTTSPLNIPVAIEIPGSAVAPSSNINATTTTELSNVSNFTIEAPQGPSPTISSISAPPNSMANTPFCQPNGFILTVNGTNFVNGSTVNWNGAPQATIFGSSTQLTATITAADAAFPVPVIVTVSNPSAPAPSSTVAFTLTNPAPPGLPSPILSSLSQTSITAGVNAVTFTLTVNGSSFVPCSVVQWGGSPRATVYVNPTQLTATIPATDVFTAGPGMTSRSVPVTVFTLPPGGGTSSDIKFRIDP